jgi:hypothetical protein
MWTLNTILSSPYWTEEEEDYISERGGSNVITEAETGVMQ